MSNYVKLYWLTRLDSLELFFVLTSVLLGAAIIAAVIFNFMSRDFDEFHRGEALEARVEFRNKVMSKLKLLILSFIFFILSSILIPNQKQVIFIVAGGKTIDFIQKDTSINKIPEQTSAIISKYLDEKIKEMEQDISK